MNLRECFKEQFEMDKEKLVTVEKIALLTGKSLYSNYAEGDKILHFMLRDKIDMSAGYPKVALTVKTVVERELDKMAEEYKYIETMHGFPIFERIE